MRAQIVEDLAQKGIELCTDLGVDPKVKFSPICRMWAASEEPEIDEIKLLGRFVQHQLISHFAPRERNKIGGLGANTCTVWKKGGRWLLNKDSWEGRMWVPCETLPLGLKEHYQF